MAISFSLDSIIHYIHIIESGGVEMIWCSPFTVILIIATSDLDVSIKRIWWNFKHHVILAMATSMKSEMTHRFTFIPRPVFPSVSLSASSVSLSASLYLGFSSASRNAGWRTDARTDAIPGTSRASQIIYKQCLKYKFFSYSITIFSRTTAFLLKSSLVWKCLSKEDSDAFERLRSSLSRSYMTTDKFGLVLFDNFGDFLWKSNSHQGFAFWSY